MKRNLLILFLCLFFVCTSSSISASETIQDGIKISTSFDKAEYQEGDQPEISVYVSNLNEYDVSNVKVENILPSGFLFVDETHAVQEIDVLEAGATIKIDLKLKHIKDDNITSGEQNQNDQNNTNLIVDDENKTNINSTDNDKNSSLSTGDKNKVSYYIVLLLIAVIVILIVRKKRLRKFLGIILCISLVSTVLNSADVYCTENTVEREMFTSTIINYNYKEFEIGTSVYYEISNDKINYIDPNVEELVDAAFNKEGKEELKFEYDNKNLPVTEVNVSYTLVNGTGVVTVEDVSKYSYLSTSVGAVSAPVNFHVYEDEIEKAVIMFKYDPSLLGEIDENALRIAWYDETNQEVVILEDTVLDSINNTISVETNHFSQYIVIDTNKWYEEWAIEQLVIRNFEGPQTPYYNIVFALDGSGSMSGDKEELCEKSTIEFIRNLKGYDKISVMSFDDSTSVYIENTLLKDISMDEIEEKISQIRSGGGTDYEKGLNTALSLIISGRNDEDKEDTISRQSLLIFLSDGEPTTKFSADTLDQLQYLAEIAGCRAVSIGLGNEVNETYLREIAEAGKGSYFYVSNSSQLTDVFSTINDWYVGSTVDSDGDGLPDIVETTGMRTQFGEFIRTDPMNSDTDGDGINDGEEMGTFVFREEGKSEFKISSNPTIPTYFSDESKIVVEKIALKTVKPSYDEMKMMNFTDLYNMYSNYNAIFCARAELLEVAADNLSEMKYQDAQLRVDFKFNTSCVDTKEISKDFDTVNAGSAFSCEVGTTCKNNILNCEEDHNQIIFSVNNLNGIVDTSEAKKERLNALDSWKKLLSEKEMLIQSEFNTAQTQMTNNISTFLDSVQLTKEKAVKQILNSLSNNVEAYIGIPATVPSDIKEGFMNLFNSYINNDLITNISSYEDVEISTDLVNKIFEEIAIGNNTLEFTTSKGIKCTFSYKNTGIWGGAYFEGILTNNSTNETYLIGGTQIEQYKIEKEMTYLKEFADMKIEEVKESFFSDSIGLLYSDELIDFLKDTIENGIFDHLQDVSPLIAQKAEKLYNQINNFKEVEKAYNDIMDLDFSDTDYDDLTEELLEYTNSLNNWYQVMTNVG